MCSITPEADKSHIDYACSRLTFAPETDLDADLAQEGRRPAQPSRKRPRRIGPGLGLGSAFPCLLFKGAQKIRGGPRPYRPCRHQSAHCGGDRVRLNDPVDRLVAVA